MTRIFLTTLFVSLSAAFESRAEPYLVIDSAGDYLYCVEVSDLSSDTLVSRERGESVVFVKVSNAEYASGWAALSSARQDEIVAAAEDASQDAKSDTLKMADNAFISLLWRTGYLATNETSVASGLSYSVETNLLAQALANPTNATIDSLISRFNAVRGMIERYGGDPDDATLHALP